MAQKLRKHGKNWKKTSVGCDIDFTILLSMLKVKNKGNCTIREEKIKTLISYAVTTQLICVFVFA